MTGVQRGSKEEGRVDVGRRRGNSEKYSGEEIRREVLFVCLFEHLETFTKVVTGTGNGTETGSQEPIRVRHRTALVKRKGRRSSRDSI